MSKAKTGHLIRAAEELREFLSKGQEYRKHNTVDRAFVYWYLEARFGDEKRIEKKVTDGESDGGIDAVVRTEASIFILQMKYESRPRLSNLLRGDVVGVEKLKSRFEEESHEEFETWLKSVRSDLRPLYRKIFSEIRGKKIPVKYLLVTTKKSTFEVTADGIEIEDYRKVLPLWELYQEGFTPPIDSLSIDLRNFSMTEDVRGRFTTYVGLADIKQFRAAMARDKNERLFAQNVRTHLKSTVNESILDTFEKEPEKFWLGNNGIYIVCRDITSSGSTVKLIFPSIINGSQTLHSVNQSQKNHSCNILVRILKLSEDDQKLLSEIIRRTNSQNAMNLVNLWAHDPFQFNIARFLHRHNVFYERREKEWRNEKKDILDDFTPISVKELAQWLSVRHPEIGMGPARSQVASLFEGEGHYTKLFGDFDKRLSSHRYDDLILLSWSGLFVKSVVKKLGARNSSRAKIAHLFLTKTVYEAIHGIPQATLLFGEKLKKGEFGRRNMPKPIVALMNRMVTEVVKIQLHEQRSNIKLDFSNFFKRKDLPEMAYSKVVSSSSLKRFSREIHSRISMIY